LQTVFVVAAPIAALALALNPAQPTSAASRAPSAPGCWQPQPRTAAGRHDEHGVVAPSKVGSAQRDQAT
jgi:hypothetical protein